MSIEKDRRAPKVDPRRPELLTYEETAARLNVCTRTVRRLVEAGRLHAVNLGPRTIRFRADLVEGLLK